MRKYMHITFADRKQIAAYMAERLEMSTKAIYLKLRIRKPLDEAGGVILDHNQRRAYNPVLAQQRAQANLREPEYSPRTGFS